MKQILSQNQVAKIPENQCSHEEISKRLAEEISNSKKTTLVWLAFWPNHHQRSPRLL